MQETKEDAPRVPILMQGEKPTITEQIAYIKQCLEESEKDLVEIEDQATTEPEFTEYADRMKGLIIMLRAINENLIAVRMLEKTGFVIEKEVSNG